MTGSIDYRQGWANAAESFQGTMIDATGAKAIADNLEQTADQHPPEYARGMRGFIQRVRQALEDINP